MTSKFSTWLKCKRMTIGAAALSCAAIVYVAAAGGCYTGDAFIHDECPDAGATDGGDAGGENSGSPCSCI